MDSHSPYPSSSAISSIDLDEHDESVRIAVRALGDMRNSGGIQKSSSRATPQQTPALSTASSSTTPSLPSPSFSHEDILGENEDFESPPGLVSRVSHLPLVNTALRAYEQGKNSSRVVKYGAEMMESSVKTISRPVIDRLPVNVNQLDEFACRQLDRLGRYRRPSSGEPEPMRIDTNRERAPDTAVDDDDDDGVRSSAQDVSMSGARIANRTRSAGAMEIPTWLEANSPFALPPPPPPDSRTPTPHLNEEQERQVSAVAQRSRWQSVLTEAGGISAALSEESMRRLKYCLQWLQYATTHLDAQILILRDFIASLQPLPSTSETSPTFLTSPAYVISPTHLRTLTDVRRDVVHTIRQVVDVVSKYAGGALPEPARTHVRGFILHLPKRWASATQTHEQEGARRGPRTAGGRYAHAHHRGGSASTSPASSRASSPLASPRIMARSPLVAGPGGGGMGVGAATQAAQRILTLATESLDMMRGVTGVVKDSLDRADAWVGRLRVVGLQRPHAEEEAGSERDPELLAQQGFHPSDPGPDSSPSLERDSIRSGEVSQSGVRGASVSLNKLSITSNERGGAIGTTLERVAEEVDEKAKDEEDEHEAGGVGLERNERREEDEVAKERMDVDG